MSTSTATDILNKVCNYSEIVASNRKSKRASIVEKIQNDYILSSFDYDALIEDDAAAEVWMGLSSTIESAREQGDDDEKVLQYVIRMTNRSALNFRAPRSSSSADNQSNLAKHAEWISAFKILNDVHGV